MLEIIKSQIAQCSSFLEAQTVLHLDRKKIKKICEENQIDYSHFKWKPVSPEHYLEYESFNLTIKEILPKIGDGKQRQMVMCQCKCGNTHITRLDGILDGRCKSCGCMSKRRECMDGNKNSAFKGIGDIPNSWFKEYERGAKRRGIEWGITITDIYNQLTKQNKLCALSGQELYFGRIRYGFETNASIDRIDSTNGYLINNVQIVTKNINIMKSTMSQEEFINNCKLVANKYKL